MELKNSAFLRTEAKIEGGALVIDTVWMAPTEYNVEDCTFTQTTAVRGGAIYYGISGGADIGKASVSTSSGTMKGLTFDSCFAAQAAGAVYFDDVDVDMDNSKFLSCSSGQFGGAIVANAGVLKMAASEFNDCRVEATIIMKSCYRLLLTSRTGSLGWNGNVLYVLESKWKEIITNEFDPRYTCDLQNDDIEMGGCAHVSNDILFYTGKPAHFFLSLFIVLMIPDEHSRENW